MKIKLKQDLIGAVSFLIFGLVLWFLMPYQIKLKNPDVINSQTFPRLIVGIMIVCSSYLFIVEVIKIVKKQQVREIVIDVKQEGKSFLIIAMLLAYWGLLHWLPFMVTSILFGVGMLFFFKCRNWRYYAIVSATIITITIMFQNILNVKLP